MREFARGMAVVAALVALGSAPVRTQDVTDRDLVSDLSGWTTDASSDLVAGGEAAGEAPVRRFDSVHLAVELVYAQDFELYPPDLDAIVPAVCSGLCYPEGTPDNLCFCDELCLTFDDCCLDACSTCGACP